jgi:hypothetical protein
MSAERGEASPVPHPCRTADRAARGGPCPHVAAVSDVLPQRKKEKGMDSSRFDELTKALATSRSRREALKTIAATTLGSILGLGRLGTAFGAPKCHPNGQGCDTNSQCCSGYCANGEKCTCPPAPGCTVPPNNTCPCPSGQTCLNGTCCANTQVCNGVCCTSGQTCQNGLCCLSNGNHCTSGSQCCSGLCNQRTSHTCASCLALGEACTSGRQCCLGLWSSFFPDVYNVSL